MIVTAAMLEKIKAARLHVCSLDKPADIVRSKNEYCWVSASSSFRLCLVLPLLRSCLGVLTTAEVNRELELRR